ncbi:AAA family ATPase [Rhizobium johnstonii]|uniref:AAA family ATPase n=1 Tax=Rhizobium johnstonii TaxID=3019933 RepID=UPI003F954681
MAIDAGDLIFEFRRIRINHPLLAPVHSAFDTLRQLRRKILQTGVRVEASAYGLFSVSQAGKTGAVLSYLENQVVDYCYEVGLFPRTISRYDVQISQRVVVVVTLTGETLISLYKDILEAYGDPRPEGSRIDPLATRVRAYINHFNTELLIFDETQHLRVAFSVSTAMLAAQKAHDRLKGFLLAGLPIVFVGIEVAEKKIMSDQQVGLRSFRNIPFPKLDYSKPGDRKVFEDFCGILGLKLAVHGLFRKRSNFLQGDLPSLIFESVDGYLGRAARLIEAAALRANDEDADCVERRHLSLGCEDFAIANKLISYNPFEQVGGVAI